MPMTAAYRLLCGLLLAITALSCAKSENARVGRDGSATVLRIDPATLPGLRDSFNASRGKVRVLVMLSPT
jgi:hypothetical protein